MRITFSQAIDLAHQYPDKAVDLDLFALWVLYEMFGGHGELLELYFTSDSPHDSGRDSIEAVWQAVEQAREKYHEKLRELTIQSLSDQEWRLFARMASTLSHLSASEAHWLVHEGDINPTERSALAGLQSKGLVYYMPFERGWRIAFWLSRCAPTEFNNTLRRSAG
jgi:hypothetical protein